MINRADALECFEKELFGGPGSVHFTKIVNEHGLADKGRLFNVGVIARQPEYLPYIRASLSAPAVAEWYRHQFDNPADRRVDAYEVPGFHALNFVVHDAQGGGINMSPRFDPAAKSMGQVLLEMPVKVPAAMAAGLKR